MRRLALTIPMLTFLALACGTEGTPFTNTSGGAGGTGTSVGTGGKGGAGGAALSYAIVDTGQVYCYDATVGITCPAAGAPFHGQDAQFLGHQPHYTPSADGLTVLDEVTGLTWQRSPDTNGDGVLDVHDKATFAGAKARCQAVAAAKVGGFDDWRLPSIKELYSLIDFRGTDPSGLEGDDTSGLTPFLDRTAFQFAYGQPSQGERIIDSQYASSTLYVNKSWTGADQLFGVNFADGRIKGYDLLMPSGAEKTFFVQCVRGNPAYGKNAFVDNADQTISDAATGLTWARDDSGVPLAWEEALAWVEARNAESFLGHADWRLPNVKELQSLLDYTRSPDTTQSAAIDPLFHATAITNEDGKADYPWYWASTTHASYTGHGAGAYVAFGRAGGWQKATPSASCYTLMDVHGAGAQRSDPKVAGNLPVIGQACSGGTAYGLGPQGDALRGKNHARLVRGGATPGEVDAGPPPDASAPQGDGGPPPSDGGPPQGDGGVGPKSCNTQADCDAAGACPSILGCACTQTPSGKACVPKCQTSADCPKPPGMNLVCGAGGICVPG